MVVLIALMRRDFGPMRKAEQAAFDGEEPAVSRSAAAEQEVPAGRAWYAVVPVLTLIGVAVALLFTSGMAAVAASESPPQAWGAWLRQVLSNSDAYNSILYGALASLLAAAVIALGTRALTLGKTVDSATDVVSRMLPTFVVLALAWALSATVQDLRLAEVAQARLQQGGVAGNWLPVLIFISAAVVSFATGTSWGTMAILCPATVQISAGVLADLPAGDALPLFYASVGAVLSGAIFGDHCSPISDTTVLSALASECTLEQHVWTQMPYALTVGVVSILCGDALSSHFELSPWIGIGAGTAALTLILLVIGRPPRGVDATRYPA
jgi:Na+/H+ antiporter NhaC